MKNLVFAVMAVWISGGLPHASGQIVHSFDFQYYHGPVGGGFPVVCGQYGLQSCVVSPPPIWTRTDCVLFESTPIYTPVAISGPVPTVGQWPPEQWTPAFVPNQFPVPNTFALRNSIGGPVNAIVGPTEPILPEPSSHTSILKSLRTQIRGDHWFRKQEFSAAYRRYRDAVNQARDRGAAHLRLTIALAAINQFDRAAEQLKKGLRADPALVEEADTLETVFGPENEVAKQGVLLAVLEWLEEEKQNPDRLFLAGALLQFDGQTERAKELLESGRKLSPRAGWFDPLLAAIPPANANEP
ncbi:tetratricopeptide repeat protein [Thalassoroseus pseudoceratinae]|uniref:tetratricopeptide repeat protein n=1 Tax=Thalassoroseus pseudoceratinae TaxID=2713176 RepID=UPI001420DC74|nr:tetratricopeptide repeat protein [Thalassoroseus pseudoceratinae]